MVVSFSFRLEFLEALLGLSERSRALDLEWDLDLVLKLKVEAVLVFFSFSTSRPRLFSGVRERRFPGETDILVKKLFFFFGGEACPARPLLPGETVTLPGD
jgi:hypothetical protein